MDIDWRTVGDIGSIGAAVIAALAWWRSTSSRAFELRMQPYRDRLDRLLEDNSKSQEDHSKFQEEVREEFQSLTRQVSGIQVNTAERYASKADLENRFRDLRHEIGVADRLDRLGQRMNGD